MKKSSNDQIILETLSKQGSHLTSHQIFESVHRSLPAINPSTVYRSLERLVSLGRVTISDMGLGASVYEMTGEERHHHLVCQICGTITKLPDERVSPWFDGLEKEFKFTIKTNHLVLFGVCSVCQNNT
jgi:Fur family ferric uptake transcriptional regulator